MPDPFDDGWSDLAAELGVETPKVEKPPPLPPDDETPPEDLSVALFDEGALPDAAEPGPDTEVIELGGTDGEADRKRRRRRRRKKKGEPGDASDGEAARETAPVADEGVTQPSELLRDILKNWDVPGWDEIVGGLHRPNR